MSFTLLGFLGNRRLLGGICFPQLTKWLMIHGAAAGLEESRIGERGWRIADYSCSLLPR